MFQVNPLLGKIKPYFLQYIQVKNQNVVCCNFCLGLYGLNYFFGDSKAENHFVFAVILYLYSDRMSKKNVHFHVHFLNSQFHAVKWKNLVFISSIEICKCFYAMSFIFLHNFCKDFHILLELACKITLCLKTTLM